MEKVYAYKNTKEILMESSSGGAFWGIAEAFFNIGGGYCYGAKFDSTFRVIHAVVDSLEGCKAFRGSKYVQSDISNCFTELEKQLGAGKRVLFTGTPCQVAAVRGFLNKKGIDTTNLFTVDIVCHGAPNPAIWNDFVEHLQEKENSKLKSFSFRYKPHGWKGYPIYAEFTNGKKIINTIGVSSYQNMFRKNLLMRKGCFSCPYPGKFQSDLTICDFWGVEICAPDILTDGGVSLIQSHTMKGSNLITEMKKKCGITIVEVLGEEYKKYNHNLVYPTERPANYEMFWDDYKNKGLNYVLLKYGDENLIGRVLFYGKDLLRRSGMADKVKKLMGRA